MASTKKVKDIRTKRVLIKQVKKNRKKARHSDKEALKICLFFILFYVIVLSRFVIQKREGEKERERYDFFAVRKDN